ncbi:MAG: glutamate-1-semialdehyde 2,1-aminomutase [Deltaproteobacteria bacterium]|nr:glutamate-1-semialdehyde 2,1-aminomutase [Deltaproteobacteria bacterium]
MTESNSQKLFARARTLIPGGVNSPVRACRSVGADPLFIARGQGAKIWDEDGNEYLDYVCSWGPLILGHAPATVIKAVRQALESGSSFGAPTALEVRLAELLVECVPSLEMVRVVNSGTEATMSAIRLARAVTGRSRIIKFDGCYHGHADSLLVAAGSGVATLGIPGSPGVPEEIARLTLSLPFNDLKPLVEAFAKFGPEIAAVIVEPVVGNMGVVAPREDFLPKLAALCRENGTLFIMDEVITGFRLGLGGAQAKYGLNPDLTCLGKIIGGGLPVGAYGGKREIMSRMAPEGNVYQAGTLSGNPLAMAAGVATIEALQADPGLYDRIEVMSAALAKGLAERAGRHGRPVCGNQVGSLSTLFFTPGPVVDWTSAAKSDTKAYAAYYRGMRERGFYLAPSQYEATMVSAAHTPRDIERTIAAADEVFASI